MNPPPNARSRGAGIFVVAIVTLLATTSCHKKVSAKQCDELLDRFIELVAKEEMPDASAEKKATTRSEAKADPAFKNCTSEVQPDEFACAMKAPTTEAMLKCLE